jgi:hypothetical protein
MLVQIYCYKPKEAKKSVSAFFGFGTWWGQEDDGVVIVVVVVAWKMPNGSFEEVVVVVSTVVLVLQYTYNRVIFLTF